MTRQTMHGDGGRVTLPVLSAAELLEADTLARTRYGLQPLQWAENAGRGVARLLVGEFGDQRAVGLRTIVLVGPHRGGLVAAVAARHLVNRGGRLTVLLAERPRAFPELHRGLLSMLSVLGLEIQVARSDDVRLYLSRDAVYDRILDGLGGSDASAPNALTQALIRGIRASRGIVVSLECPAGADPDGAVTPGDAARGDVVVPTATVALGAPLPIHEKGDAAGRVHLVDVSYPLELFSDLGCPIAPPFDQQGSVVLG